MTMCNVIDVTYGDKPKDNYHLSEISSTFDFPFAHCFDFKTHSHSCHQPHFHPHQTTNKHDTCPAPNIASSQCTYEAFSANVPTFFLVVSQIKRKEICCFKAASVSVHFF